MSAIIKCRKCRYVVIEQQKTPIFDRHSSPILEPNNSVSYDCGQSILDAWYFQENGMPEWMIDRLNQVRKSYSSYSLSHEFQCVNVRFTITD